MTNMDNKENNLKVAIVTIESFNFGNRLQNYALQHLLEKMNCKVETIRRNPLEHGIGKLKAIAKNCAQTMLQSKGAKFHAFDKMIHKSSFYASANQAPDKLADHYDFFIAGSDQVWNPHYQFVGSVDYLTFARPEQKIAYAGSFGVSELPEEMKEQSKIWFENFESISVREDAGAQIIKNLTGRTVPVVLDPTLMLAADEWRKLEKQPSNIPKGEYILVYSVASMGQEMSAAVAEVKKTHLVVDIRETLKNGHEWAVGPAEFLYLIDHARELYTDSFHGTVFSILFHTKFKVFEREGIVMNSRIETLLKETNMINEDSFENVDSRLIELRKNSHDFLRNALGKNRSK